MTNRWYRFYDLVYAEMIKRNLGSCPVGETCAPHGWACCQVWGKADSPLEAAMLPNEAWWQQNNAEMLKNWDSGCPTCMSKKGILCQLWPVVPLISAAGEKQVQLWLACEALALAPIAHIRMVEFCEWIMELLDSKFRIIQHEFTAACLEAFVVEGEVSITMSVLAAKRFLRSNYVGEHVKRLMSFEDSPKEMNESFRRLPMIP